MTNSATLSELMERIRRGEEQAAVEFFEKTDKVLDRWCAARRMDRQAPFDTLMQSIRIKLILKIRAGTLEPIEHRIRGLIQKMAEDRHKDALRRQGRNKETGGEVGDLELASNTESPSQHARVSELAAAVAKYISEQPKAIAKLLQRRLVDCLEFERIAELEGLPENSAGALRARYHRELSKLRESLARIGFDPRDLRA